MPKPKFTFKTIRHNRSALQSSAGWSDRHYDILFNKFVVGDINPKTFQIGLMVIKDDIAEDGNTNCPWKWVRLARASSNVDEAKAWLNTPETIELILKKYNLRNDE